jgi:23S rRNA (adenine2503-C2)-methyltransferase
LNDTKPFFFDYNFNEIVTLMLEWGENNYRAIQLFQGIHKNLISNPMGIPNLPHRLRERLDDYFSFSHLNPIRSYTSSTGETIKNLFRLPDGQAIECVLMRYKDRQTLCISTQSGCAMGCVFCATGQMGFKRHLSSGEIVEQVVSFARELKSEQKTVTNVVLMGMGEPFHNYDATLDAIDRMNDPLGMNIGSRRFTISTVGLVPMIRRFADERRQINLAVSLHAADDELRSSMLPINKKYPLKDLIDVCGYYVEKTKRRITFEWALIKDVNDSKSQAENLANLLQGLNSHVNVIPLNPTTGYSGKATTRDRAREFRDELVKRGIPCTIRIRRGIEIQAGCGQLAIANQ